MGHAHLHGHGDAIDRVRAELTEERFSVLTEIGVAATLEKRAGVDFRAYIIIGACIPPFARRSAANA